MMNKTIVYYTCNTHDLRIDEPCRTQLLKGGVPIIAVSLNQQLDFGDISMTVLGERSPLMMHEQILLGLQKSDAGLVFLCESDVMYHPSHFNVMPSDRDIISYNVNVWRVRWSDGLAVWTDDLQQISGICADRDLLLEFYARRVSEIKRDGFNRHYEPRGYGTQNQLADTPNLCIRHGRNLTKSKWSPDEFRNKKYAAGWRTTFEVPGWSIVDHGGYLDIQSQ